MPQDPNTPPPDEAELLTAKELAGKLKTSDRLVRYWAADGIIPEAIRVGRIIRYREADVLAALEAARTSPAATKGGEDIASFAMWLLAPDVANMPTWLIDREPTSEEDRLAAERAAVHWPNLRDLGTREERRAYCEATIAAAHMADRDGKR